MEYYDYEVKHIQKVRELTPECMVLLKSNGAFPLQEAGEIALYGNAARKTIKGGTGSGDVNVRHYTTVEEGLERAGFTITTKEWLDEYDALWKEANRQFKAGIKAKIAAEGLSAIMLGIGAIMREPEYELPMVGTGETALYVLGRISGEGADRTPEKGDFQLTDTEVHNILTLQKQYKNFMLVLNVGGVVDLSPVVDEVDNILLLSQTGIAIGDAFADVLLGKSYPSGKLTSTWAKWEDYCHEGDFGNTNDTLYKEGIYVGYRYFDTVGKHPMFSFGYGLGYTTFSITSKEVRVQKSQVTVMADVKNTGKHKGKEVVQLYVSVPSGKLDQPYQVLAAFVKTKELEAGEIQSVSLCFDLTELGAFDGELISNILEKGDYVMHIGNSSQNTVVCGVLQLEDDVVVQKLHDVGGTPDFIDWKPERPVKVQIPKDIPVIKISGDDISGKNVVMPLIDEKALETAQNMTEHDLACICVGAYNGSAGSNSVIGNAGVTVAGSAGETTGLFKESDIPALIMADGPAGLRLSRQYGIDENGVYSLDRGSMEEVAELLPEAMLAYLGFDKEPPKRDGEIHDQYCTAIPIGVALAQSWSEEVCEICGDIVGAEMEMFGVHIWLAPALNIHRFPLCGRNFEYYSEDPLISGKMAAAITRGTQKHAGCGVSVKHFCCNNQETNRMHSNSQVSQRALREIYMKGFEIAIKESNPATVMSSYNLLNGEHTSARYDLMETVLREEWGYEGIVMSDWVSGNINKPDDKYPGALATGAVKAGNDIFMPGTAANHAELLQALEDDNVTYPITRADLEKCAARMIAMAWRLGRK
ncbi:MAG: glycoside hydrolase family 3 C-terminal domain-containing protein [Agathobacter sp.]|nr:glycoside hydrolase family 3 C-terminal domain-containing protein [Agathobacter sp.]MBQ6812988.1 glycoside hydrolase family 3 C-terminal domain-containing protein [Agathobacter sp.]